MYRTSKSEHTSTGIRDKEFAPAQTSSHTDLSWKDAADEVIWLLARRQELLTSEDVRVALSKRYPDASAEELRALGPVMTRAAKNGWIEKHSFGYYKARSRHGAPCLIWKSKILIAAAK